MQEEVSKNLTAREFKEITYTMTEIRRLIHYLCLGQKDQGFPLSIRR